MKEAKECVWLVHHNTSHTNINQQEHKHFQDSFDLLFDPEDPPSALSM